MPALFRIGFTGTQQGLTARQYNALYKTLDSFRIGPVTVEVHHGDCVGADAQFHEIATGFGFLTVGHIPDDDSKRAHCTFHEQREPLPYLIRNRNIVNECEVLIACPKEDRMVARSGTWATVRHAVQTNRPIVFIYQSGITVWPEAYDPTDLWPEADDETAR